MNFWLITLGEPVWGDEESPRFLRTAVLAQELVARGHTATYWSSTVDHVRKKSRANFHKKLDISKNLTLNLLHGPLYTCNISLARIRHNRVVGREFRKIAPTLDAPDAILVSYPTVELCLEALRYGKKRNIPVLVDIRDFWPDIFQDLVPDKIRPLARFALFRSFQNAAKVFREADAITGITDEAISWAVQKTGMAASAKNTCTFPLASFAHQTNFLSNPEDDNFWASKGLIPKNDRLIACFFGLLSKRNKIDSVVQAAKILDRSHPAQFEFVLCGSGENEVSLREKAKGVQNLQMPGWVNAKHLRALLDIADAGLLPYSSSRDFMLSYPNKVGEYFSGGIPVVTSLKGAVEKLIRQHDCGIVYPDETAEGLAKALVFLKNNPDRLAQLKKNAARVFDNLFDAEKVYSDFCDYLEKIAISYP